MDVVGNDRTPSQSKACVEAWLTFLSKGQRAFEMKCMRMIFHPARVIGHGLKQDLSCIFSRIMGCNIESSQKPILVHPIYLFSHGQNLFLSRLQPLCLYSILCILRLRSVLELLGIGRGQRMIENWKGLLKESHFSRNLPVTD